MEPEVIDMGEQMFLLINAPLFFFNIAVNIFFACCLMFPSDGRQRLKHPLKSILGTIVFCSIFYFIFLAIFSFTFQHQSDLRTAKLMLINVEFYAYNSMACYVWLNFFYYTQIVPAHGALLIWVKKNIKTVIHVLLTFDGIFFLLNCSVSAADALTSTWDVPINGTFRRHGMDELLYVDIACFISTEVHLFVCCLIMIICSFSTARYLNKHVQNMAKGGSGFTAPRVQSQMRAAITGIVQGILCLSYYTFNFKESVLPIVSAHSFYSSQVSFTAASLYITGTTVNLSIGQAKFRHRAAEAWKALKAQLGIGTITHEEKRRPSPLTE